MTSVTIFVHIYDLFFHSQQQKMAPLRIKFSLSAFWFYKWQLCATLVYWLSLTVGRTLIQIIFLGRGKIFMTQLSRASPTHVNSPLIKLSALVLLRCGANLKLRSQYCISKIQILLTANNNFSSRFRASMIFIKTCYSQILNLK